MQNLKLTNPGRSNSDDDKAEQKEVESFSGNMDVDDVDDVVVGRLASPGFSLDDAVKRLGTLRSQVVAAFPERETFVDACLDALVSSEHCLAIGPPGVAKSAVTKTIAKAIDANLFEYDDDAVNDSIQRAEEIRTKRLGKHSTVKLWAHQFTRYTSPDEILGPFSLKKMEQDRLVRNSTGKLPEADMAIFEEVFNANSAVLNATLGVLNERVWFDDGVEKPCPLRTAIMNTNTLPTKKDNLEAMHDRICERVFVGDVEGDDTFDSIMWDEPKKVTAKISMAELDLIWEVAAAMPVDDKTKVALRKIRTDIKKLGIYVSPRRYKKGIKICRAYATRHGDKVLLPVHLIALKRVCWNKTDEIGSVNRIIDDVAGSWKTDVKLMNEVLSDIFNMIKGEDSGGVPVRDFDEEKMIELHDKIKTVKDMANKLVSGNAANVIAVEAQRHVDNVIQLCATAVSQATVKLSLNLL